MRNTDAGNIIDDNLKKAYIMKEDNHEKEFNYQPSSNHSNCSR